MKYLVSITIMNIIYNSDQYSVVEFGADKTIENLYFGGYEIVDKSFRRETFIAGTLANFFRKGFEDLIATKPSVEDVDTFLGKYNSMMNQPVILQ